MLSLNRLGAKVLGKVPLQNVLLASFVLPIVVVVGLVGYLSFRNGQRAVNDISSQLRIQIVERIYIHLETYLQMPHLLNQANENAIAHYLLKASSLREFESFLLKQMHSFELVPYTAWGNEKGEYIGIDRITDSKLHIEVVDKPTNPKYYTYAVNSQAQRGKLLYVTPFYDPRTRPWYKVAIQKGKATWSSIYVWFNQPEMAIDAVLPVYDQKGNILGVLDTPLKLSKISDYLQQLPISKSGQSFIIDRSGLLVATSENSKPFIINKNKPQRIKASDSKNPLIRSTAQYLNKRYSAFAKINTPMQLELSHNNQSQFVQLRPFQDGRGIDWLIVVVVPETDFMEQIDANTRTTILLCIVALLVATGVGILTARWITRPILRLNINAKHIAKGEWDKTVEELERSDEVGQLAKSFNSMAVQLRKSFADLRELNQNLECRVIERTAQLEAANKELEAFSYSVSHDLRAPLRQIDGFSQLLLRRCADKLDEKGKDYLQRICANTHDMGELINDLLTLSRVSRGELNRTSVDLSALATEISARLQETQPERKVEWAIAPELYADGDARLLRVVLENLLNNAWKFTSNQTYSHVELNAILKEDDKIVYFVRDNGAGFDMAYADKLFGAFQRLHSVTEFPGTGIGLATVQRIIHRHGGQVWAEGVEEAGATFYFTLSTNTNSKLTY